MCQVRRIVYSFSIRFCIAFLFHLGLSLLALISIWRVLRIPLQLALELRHQRWALTKAIRGVARLNDHLVAHRLREARERVSRASNEFNTIVSDPLMRNSAILIFANKQDMKGSLSPAEVCEQLGMSNLRDRTWHVQGTVATKGEGLYEGLDWLSTTLRNMQRSGISTSVNNAPPPPR